MADNVTAAAASGGATFRAFSDGANEWPANVVCYVAGGSAGAWTLQQVDTSHGLPVAIQGTVPVSGTFWQATQPVSAASLPLPTGAATSAKQPALGTAGTASADVLTVQGIASMTALKVDGSAVTQPVSGTVTANAGTGSFTVAQATASNLQAQVQGAAASGAAKAGNPVQMGGVFNTTQPTVTTGQAVEAQATARGALIVATGVDVFHATIDNSTLAVTQSGTWNVGTVTTVTSITNTVTVSGTVTANQGGAPWSNNVTQWAGTAVDVNSGLKSAGTLRVVLATDQPQLTNALKVDGSAVTQPVSGTVTANVGTTGGLALDATLTGGSQKAIPVAGTTGGATPYHLVSAASTNSTSVKASAGTVYDVQCFNVNASPRYLKFFDKASAPTLGTDTPVKTILIPGNTSGAGATATFPVGVNFANGIAIAITGGIADSDNTAVGASDCAINFDYK